MVPWLDPNDDLSPFPSLDTALEEPNGLLAAGGSLSSKRLLKAYREGIFPWFEGDQPILWWSPDPRMVVRPEELHVSKSLKKTIKRQTYNCSIDTAFSDVILACSKPRDDQLGTWITDSMILAYEKLHQLGHAHSVEVWHEGELVGGLYGIAIGKVFFGESMFSLRENSSKVGFAYLCDQLNQWGYQLIDCQVESAHLVSLGCYTIPRDIFAKKLKTFCYQTVNKQAWVSHD
jgi:leucyl/phenylalanyl-tRNA--protein transferase